MIEKNNISVVMSYHDLDIVNFKVMFEQLTKISHNIYPLNNNYHTTQTLIDLRSKYNYSGVVFDEFNSQAYFAENISDTNEYIYHTHYRRYMDMDSVNLNINEVYLVGSDASVKTLLKVIFEDNVGLVYNDDVLNKVKTCFAQAMNIGEEYVSEVFDSEQPTPVREMFICHKGLYRQMVGCTYKFIDLFCSSFDESVLNKNRIVGYMIELFEGFFFKVMNMIGCVTISYIPNVYLKKEIE